MSGPSRSLLRHPDFLKLWTAETASVFGTAITQLALPLIAATVLNVTPFEFGLLTTIEFLPFILLSLPAGVWVDRLRRRPILIAGDIGRAVAIASIPIAFYFDVLTIWQLYIVGFVNGCLTVFFDVAWQSYLPSVVERDQLVEGNSKLQITQSAEQADEDARDAGTQDLRRRLRDLQLGVALHQLVALDDGREVALPRDVEEHRQAAVDEAHDVQLPDRQHVEVERDRDRGDGDRPPDVARDEDRPSPQAVDPHAGRQAEEDERQELVRGQKADLERGNVEDGRRDERQGELRDGGPEDRRGLGRPQLEEVGVAQEAAARATHRTAESTARPGADANRSGGGRS